jgi:hypothetical protein
VCAELAEKWAQGLSFVNAVMNSKISANVSTQSTVDCWREILYYKLVMETRIQKNSRLM